MNERRYDIDWLRTFSIFLLIIYHAYAIFQPWGKGVGIIQNEKPLDSLVAIMHLIGAWRIPLLFFISGMGMAFSLKKRSRSQLFSERTRRIFIPFLFGVLIIVPIHKIIFQNFYDLDFRFFPSPAHLWFLANLFAYVIILLPFINWIKKASKYIFSIQIFKFPLFLILITVSIILEGIIINPENVFKYASSVHGFSLGFIVFFWGFCCSLNGDFFFKAIIKWRWVSLLVAITLYFFVLFYWELAPPIYIFLIETSVWIFAIIGFSAKYINFNNKVLNYLSCSSYPIYICHMIFLYLSAYFITPLNINTWLKYILIISITFACCVFTYELIIKRINWLRPFLGLKKTVKKSESQFSLNNERLPLID